MLHTLFTLEHNYLCDELQKQHPIGLMGAEPARKLPRSFLVEGVNEPAGPRLRRLAVKPRG